MNADEKNIASDHWSAFEQRLAPYHLEFIASLLLHHPSLSRTEIRICSMIRLGLNTHEIATLLGIAERGAESCRQSIRKKLGLKKGEEIRMFLESI